MAAFTFLKDTYKNWSKNDPFAKSAAVAYYALFSLPSLLIISVYLAGIFFGQQAVEGKITQEVEGLIGVDSAQLIQSVIANSALSESSTLFILVGIGTLIFGASGVFIQLQKALNDIWSVRVNDDGLWHTVKDRAVAFGMVLIIGFLLLLSLLLNSLISGFSDFIGGLYVSLSPSVIQFINFVVSQLVITALFTAIFVVLPDVKTGWRINRIGAFVTTLLFLGGKYLIGFYFSKSDPASAYGAAGSLVLILLWIYYSCLILFFGAEFTVNWAKYRKIKIEPNDSATWSYELEIKALKDVKNKKYMSRQ